MTVILDWLYCLYRLS